MPTDPNKFPKVQFRTYRSLNEQLLSRITADAGYNERAKKMIERHLWLLTNEYERLANERFFTIQEELAIFDACKGMSLTEEQIAILETVVSSAFRARGLASKWQVSDTEVFRKVADLSLTGKLAIVDVAERFWTTEPEQRLTNIMSLARAFQWSDELIKTALISFELYGQAGMDLLKKGCGLPDWVEKDPI